MNAEISKWVVDDEGRLRRETKPRMGRRLPGFDYRRPGCYVVTIVLADRRSGALGELVVRRKPSAGADGGTTDGGARAEGADGAKIDVLSQGRLTNGENENVGSVEAAGSNGQGWLTVVEAKTLGLRPEEVEAKIVFSELGRAIFDHFRRIGEFTRGLRPVFCAVMPDHLHLLVEIVTELERPLGNAIGGFKTGCEKIFAKIGGEGRLFAAGFVDEIVLRAGQLSAEFNYLIDNPRRLAIKRLFPELFKVTREIWVNFRLAPNGLDERGVDLRAPKGPDERGYVPIAPTAPAGGRFSAIGNHFLLTRPAYHQVQCSRRYFAYDRDSRGRLLKDAAPAIKTAVFDEKLVAALAAAKKGAVVVSPCISHGEREIARQVFATGGRVITLANKGFSPLYKPGGKLFENCAAGNLLMLSPIGWPYQPAERPMTRVDALVLNRIAQLIAGAGSEKIDYKGVKVDGIDNEVRRLI